MERDFEKFKGLLTSDAKFLVDNSRKVAKDLVNKFPIQSMLNLTDSELDIFVASFSYYYFTAEKNKKPDTIKIVLSNILKNYPITSGLAERINPSEIAKSEADKFLKNEMENLIEINNKKYNNAPVSNQIGRAAHRVRDIFFDSSQDDFYYKLSSQLPEINNRIRGTNS